MKYLHVSIVRIDSEVQYEADNKQFLLENTPEGLQYIESFIQSAIQKTQIQNDQIVGIGVGLVGTVGQMGDVTQYFNFMPISFKKHLKMSFKYPF